MIKILICDDSEKTVNTLNKLTQLWGKYNNTSFEIDLKTSGDFILHNEEHQYDIAFIDIEMPGISGLKLAEILKKHNPDIIVIVVTSFQSYLDDAMRIHVFRYLSKPIDKNRFYKSLNDAVKEYRNLSKTIIIDTKDEVHYVKTKDILYIENLKYGALIVTKYNEYITNKKPKEWLEIINQPNCFVSSHNSYIVNLQNVIDFSKTQVTIKKNETETICTYMSQRKYAEFKKSFFAFAGGIL